MRTPLLAIAALFVLSGCRGTEPYTATDLRQVKTAYAQIYPIYSAFKSAFVDGNRSAIISGFRREQIACKQVDVIDRRDTIDPNVQLFQASIALDNMCNSIESAYVFWAQRHGMPYDKTIVPGRPVEVFVGTDASLEKMSQYLKHPADLS